MTDREILDLFRLGEHNRALEALWENHNFALIRHAQILVNRYEVPMSPDEVASNALWRFVEEEGPRLNFEVKKSLRGLLKRMVWSEVTGVHRHIKRSAALPSELPSNSTIEEEIVNEQSAIEFIQDIKFITAVLTTRQWVPIVLRYHFGASLRQLEYFFGCGYATTTVTIHQGLKKIRSLLSRAETEEVIIEGYEENYILMRRDHDLYPEFIELLQNHFERRIAELTFILEYADNLCLTLSVDFDAEDYENLDVQFDGENIILRKEKSGQPLTLRLPACA